MTRPARGLRDSHSACGFSTMWASSGSGESKPEYKDAIPKVIAYLHKVYEEQLPFDYELDEDDKALYCVEMTEKAYRAAGLKLSDPVRLGDMERATRVSVAASGSGVRLALSAQAPA